MNTQNSLTDDHDELVVIWSSGERDVALKTVFKYIYNAKLHNWWNKITLIVWGPSAKLLASDSLVRNFLKKNMDQGINVLACKSCSDEYEVSDDLTELGIEVQYVGELLTNYIKGKQHVITF